MADLVLSVDVTSLADARKKLDGFQKAMNNLSVNRLASGIDSVQNSIKRLVEAQAKGTIGQNAYQKGLLELKRAYEQLGYSSQQATAAVRAYAAQLQRQRAAQEAARAAEELARAQAQAAARTRELRLRFQEGYAAFDRARQQMRDLREALRQGIITQDQYREALRRVREEQQRAGAGAGDLARRMNRTGVITQQAGYQMGDFIVQVQSGTNWMVAFGQQATQVAGTLTLLGGKWILIGSVLGVAIPLITAAGAAFMRTRGQGQTLDQTVEKLRESFSELSENMGMVDDVELDIRFGNLTTEVRNLARAMVELNAASELNNLSNVLDRLEESVTAGFWATLKEGFRLPGYGTISEDTPEVRERASESLFARLGFPSTMSRQDLLGQFGRMDELAGAGDREGVVRVFEEIVAQINQAEGGMAAVSQEGKNFVVQMVKTAMSTAETNAMLNGSAKAARDAAEAEKERARIAEEKQKQEERTAQFVTEQINSLEDQTTLYREIARFGENSAQVEKERARQARIAYQDELLRQKVGAELIPTLMEQYDAMVKAREESEKTTRNIEAMSRLGTDNIVAQVNNLAVALKTTAENAAKAVGGVRMLAVFQAQGGGGRGEGPQGGVSKPGQFIVTPEIEKAYQKYLEDQRKKDKKREGIGGLAQSLLTEMEQIEMFRTDALAELENFNAEELKILGGHAEARLRIEKEYQDRVAQLRKEQFRGVVDAQRAAGGAFMDFLGTLAQRSKTAAKALIIINTGLSIAQAIQNTAVASTRALAELGPVAGAAAAAKIKTFGAAQVALIAANGALRLGSVGGGGGGGSGGIGSLDAIPASAASAPVQRVVIEGIDRDSLISGEQLSRLFDRLYEENNERGLVFSVAR